MVQTENTAIVLRRVDYRDNDRLITLLNPTRGKITAVIRNCRKPNSHNLNAGELFALGDYMLIEKDGRATVTSVRLIETFYPLRSDYTRLTCGVYLLSLAEAAAEPDQERRELFMLLLHTLSRLAFSDQEWRPLIAGFCLHFAVCEGFRPRLSHCVHCGRPLDDSAPVFFDAEGGGVCCPECRTGFRQISREELRWMQNALASGVSAWVNAPDARAPLKLLRQYVELRLGRRFRSGALLPD